jgi:hypothetical protein
LKTPYLKTGRGHHILAQTDLINVAIKYYYEGGENSLHAHPSEETAGTVYFAPMTAALLAGMAMRIKG